MATYKQADDRHRYVCEKCGDEEGNFSTEDAARAALKTHMLKAHNRG